jgi:DNA polymerase III subunit gamma/tau
MAYLIFARKYRPASFDDVVGQKAVVQTLRNALKGDRVTQAYLFSGMRGVGKTTVARILAKALNCIDGPTDTPCNTCESCLSVMEDRSLDILEIDGASNRGIDDIRALRESLKYKPIQCRYKVIIIDEVHQVTGPAFNALLKTLEEPPPNTVFIFATTEFHKVPATIASRCQHFEFKKISRREITEHLSEIASREGLTVSPLGLNLIAEAADGSLRDAQSLLDQAVAFSGENIRDDDVKEILGAMSRDILFETSTAILENRPADIFPIIEKVTVNGHDLRFFHKKLMEHYRELLLAATVARPEDFILLNDEELQTLKNQAVKSSAEDLLRILLALQQGETGLRYASHPRIFLEALLVKLCHFQKLVSFQEILKDIEDLKSENQASGPGAAATPAPPRSLDAKDLMSGVLLNLGRRKAALAAVLAEHVSTRIREGIWEIFFDGAKTILLDTVRKDIQNIEKAAAEVAGRPVEIRVLEDVSHPPVTRDKNVARALEDPKVRTFVDEFKAQVLFVEPVKPSKEQS